jgi:hypothetical protein
MWRLGVLGVVLIAIVVAADGGSSAGPEQRLAGMGAPVRSDHLNAERVLTSVGDPEDVGHCSSAPDCPIDIRSIAKRPFTTASGKKMVAFSVNAYELHGGLVYVANIKFALDTRAGPPSDTQIFMAITDFPETIKWGCGRAWKAGGNLTRRYHLKERGDRLTCFVPRRALHPTKPIRFRALSRGTRFVVDRAPDSGWARA